MDAVGRRRPGDVAVLVRTNTEAAQVADWLIGWGLPVVTKNSLRLEGHPVVRQLVSLLAFLDYPLDDLALWGFVSGAEVFGGATGLGGRELADWLAALPRGAALPPALRRDFPGQCEQRLSRYVRRAGFMTPYDVVCEALDDFKVLERNPGAAPFVRRFMEVVHAAERDGRQSIASFLDYWEAGGAEEKVPPARERTRRARPDHPRRQGPGVPRGGGALPPLGDAPRRRAHPLRLPGHAPPGPSAQGDGPRVGRAHERQDGGTAGAALRGLDPPARGALLPADQHTGL